MTGDTSDDMSAGEAGGRAGGRAVAIVGAGGIGRALAQALLVRDDIGQVILISRRSDVSLEDPRGALVQVTLDVTDEEAVSGWLQGLPRLDWLINTVGMLHDENHGPEKSIRQFDSDHFLASMRINCAPTLLLAKHAHALLKRSERGVFATVSARVGSIEDNGLGGWYSYRASKAALNMALKCLAIEWQRGSKSIRVAALHPGTTDTALSEPFQANVPDDKLFTPAFTAERLLERIDSLHDMPSGQFLAWDGERIPW